MPRQPPPRWRRSPRATTAAPTSCAPPLALAPTAASPRLLERGVAFHHSGLAPRDRRVVEEAFLSGALPVLCSTSGLAQGVNLPAHLVVICNSSQYASGGYREYTNIEMLQMAGRAGRPQFDDEGVCVVMTSHDQKRRHEQILSGECTVESHMLEHMQEHLNAEIGSQPTMTSLQTCIEWFRATFLHVRIQRNPVAYRVPKGLMPAEMSARLDRIPADALRALSDASMIDLDADGAGIRSRHLGTLMARSCVKLPTMCLFRELGASSGAASILKLLSQADEFKEACVLRVAEKKTLAALNADADAIRFPIDGSRKAKCKTTASKVWLLLQVRCSGAPLGEFHGLQPLLLGACRRIVGAIVKYAECVELGTLLCAAVAVGKSLESGAGWYDESLSPFRQLAGVGAVLATKMRDASDGSLETFAQLTTARAESLCGKSVSTALAQVRSLVDGALVVDATAGQHGSSPLTVAVRVCAKTHAAEDDARWVLCVVDGASRLLMVRRFRVSELAHKGELVYELNVPPTSARHHLRANLLSVDCFGIDTAVTVELPGAEQPPELVDPAAVLADCGSKAARGKAADAKTTKAAKAAVSKQAKTAKTKQAKPTTAKSWQDAIKAAATNGGTAAARQTPQQILASLEYREDDAANDETLARHIFGEDAVVGPTEDSIDGLALESLDDAFDVALGVDLTDDAFDVALGVDLTGSPPSAPYGTPSTSAPQVLPPRLTSRDSSAPRSIPLTTLDRFRNDQPEVSPIVPSQHPREAAGATSSVFAAPPAITSTSPVASAVRLSTTPQSPATVTAAPAVAPQEKGVAQGTPLPPLPLPSFWKAGNAAAGPGIRQPFLAPMARLDAIPLARPAPQGLWATLRAPQLATVAAPQLDTAPALLHATGGGSSKRGRAVSAEVDAFLDGRSPSASFSAATAAGGPQTKLGKRVRQPASSSSMPLSMTNFRSRLAPMHPQPAPGAHLQEEPPTIGGAHVGATSGATSSATSFSCLGQCPWLGATPGGSSFN